MIMTGLWPILTPCISILFELSSLYKLMVEQVESAEPSVFAANNWLIVDTLGNLAWG